ncbi:hypothetical protein BH23CHL2_BH23CHL2_18330 [soil metagenome]
MRAYLGTRSGVWTLDTDSGALTGLGLEEHRFWAIHAWRGASGLDTILAGSYGAGIFRSTDGGGTWSQANDGLSAFALRTLQPDPTGGPAILAGTEPARGFRTLNGGESWQEFDSITDVAACYDWFLPYSPRAGAIRNFAATASGDLYASVEVGGLLQSPDRGSNWQLLKINPGPRVHDDIHFVIVDPTDDNRLYVAMGGALVDRSHGQWLDGPRQIGGVAVSTDGGESWHKLIRDYTRAVLIPSSAREWLIAAPAESTDHGGWIVGSTDRGENWERIDCGIDTPMEDMVERFEEAPDGMIWVLCSGGRLFTAEPGIWHWASPLQLTADDLAVDSVSFVDW